MIGSVNSGALAPLFDAGLADLESLVRGRPLLGFDYDGTLAPIVADPARARMRESTRLLFAELTQRFPCVVITGRARQDVLPFLAPAEPALVIGNHGAETGDDDVPAPPDIVALWRAELDERLETVPGIVIEDKSYSLTIHYRACPDRHAARAIALRASADLDDVRIIRGIKSVNLLPADLPGKGVALQRACDRLQCKTALFVGDDETDEDALGMDSVLGIRVGRNDRSKAKYCLSDQSGIDALLQRLLDLHAHWSN